MVPCWNSWRTGAPEKIKRGGLFYLPLGLFYLRLVFVTYGGLFCLQLKFGLVFFAYGGKSAGSFLLTVPLVRKVGFGLFYLRFPHRK